MGKQKCILSYLRKNKLGTVFVSRVGCSVEKCLTWVTCCCLNHWTFLKRAASSVSCAHQGWSHKWRNNKTNHMEAGSFPDALSSDADCQSNDFPHLKRVYFFKKAHSVSRYPVLMVDRYVKYVLIGPCEPKAQTSDCPRCWFQFGFVWCHSLLCKPAVQTCLWGPTNQNPNNVGLKKCVQDYNWNLDYAELM